MINPVIQFGNRANYMSVKFIFVSLLEPITIALFHDTKSERKFHKMKTKRLVVVTLIAALALATGAIAVTVNDGTDAKFLPSKGNSVTADQALKGIPMQITPYQLPSQFSSMLRDDVGKSHGVAILKQNGKDVEYTFAYWGLTSPLTQAHFHYGPHNHVAVRAQSVCGVAGESPKCPEGTTNSITGVWKNADIAAIEAGGVVIAFHTQKYAQPSGELAVYIPPAKK